MKLATYRREELLMKIKAKLTRKNGKVTWYRKVSLRRFLSFCSLGSFAKIYVKVEYGKRKDVRGKEVMFYNDGEYDDPKEAVKALRAFLE